MSTLPLNVAPVFHIRSVPGIARIGAILKFMADVFADAQQTMRDANKKHPCAGL